MRRLYGRGWTHKRFHHIPRLGSGELYRTDPAARARTRPAVVQTRGLLRGDGAVVRRQQRRRLRRPRRPHLQARLPAVARHRRALAAAVLPVAAARRRLRRLRLQGGAPRVRHARRVPRPRHEGARAQHARRDRLPAQPHLRRARVVPAVPRRPRGPVRRLLRVERHRRRSTRTSASSSSTPRSRTGRSTPCAASSSSTASSRTSPTSTSRTRPCSEAIFDIVRFWLDLGVDGIRLDAIPYLFESEEGNGEGEPEDARVHQASCARMVDDEYPGRVLIAEANQWPREVGRVLRHRRGARVPHGLRLPGDAAHLLLAAVAERRRARARALRDHRGARRAPRGASSCATTTS